MSGTLLLTFYPFLPVNIISILKIIWISNFVCTKRIFQNLRNLDSQTFQVYGGNLKCSGILGWGGGGVYSTVNMMGRLSGCQKFKIYLYQFAKKDSIIKRGVNSIPKG